MLGNKSDRSKGILALVILAFVFASMGIFVRYLKTDFTILQQTYLRIFAAFLLGLVVFYKDLDIRKIKLISNKEWLVLTFRAVSLYLIGVTLLSQAYVTTKYSNVSFVGALPMTAILGFILLKEKVTVQKVVYILIGFVGVVLIAVKDYSHILVWGQGELLALIASVFFALSYIGRKWQGHLLNNKEIAVIIFFISSFLLFITSLLFQEGLPHASSFSSFVIPVILCAGLFNVINLFLTNYGFQKLEAVLAGNLLMLEVFFAVLLGFAFYHEIPTVKECLGALFIIVSVYRMNKING